jgi:hypothetical protein
MSSLLNFFPCRDARSYASGLILILILTLALAFLLFPSPSSASTHIGLPGNYLTLSRGLVGYWPFDGKTTNWATGITADLSGNNNTGQLISMSTTTSPVPGKIGQALKFNGTSQYISNTSIVSTIASNTAGTVSVWFKLSANTASEPLITVSPPAATNLFRLNYVTPNTIQILAKAASDLYRGTIPITYDTKWHHLVFTVDSTTVAVRAGIRDNNDLIWIGKSPSFAAKLSEIREYPYTVFISKACFDKLPEGLTKNDAGTSFWEERLFKFSGTEEIIYRTKYMLIP